MWSRGKDIHASEHKSNQAKNKEPRENSIDKDIQCEDKRAMRKNGMLGQ